MPQPLVATDSARKSPCPGRFRSQSSTWDVERVALVGFERCLRRYHLIKHPRCFAQWDCFLSVLGFEDPQSAVFAVSTVAALSTRHDADHL